MELEVFNTLQAFLFSILKTLRACFNLTDYKQLTFGKMSQIICKILFHTVLSKTICRTEHKSTIINICFVT